jgi:hypothetical protein
MKMGLSSGPYSPMSPFHRAGAAGGLGEEASGEGACAESGPDRKDKSIAATAKASFLGASKDSGRDAVRFRDGKASFLKLVFLFLDQEFSRDALDIIAQSWILREIHMLPN